MTEKRFTTDYSDLLKNNKTFIKMDNERLTYEEIVDLLNKQDEKIKELTTKRDLLVQKKNRYFRLYNSSVAEVKARIDTLNKVCEYYLTEAQFKGDTDPNEAVKEVINEILNTEVEMW